MPRAAGVSLWLPPSHPTPPRGWFVCLPQVSGLPAHAAAMLLVAQHNADNPHAPTPPLTPSPYYREPVPCPPHGVPTQLAEPLVRSFGEDHFVADEGNVVFYQVRAGQKGFSGAGGRVLRSQGAALAQTLYGGHRQRRLQQVLLHHAA